MGIIGGILGGICCCVGCKMMGSRRRRKESLNRLHDFYSHKANQMAEGSMDQGFLESSLNLFSGAMYSARDQKAQFKYGQGGVWHLVTLQEVPI